MTYSRFRADEGARAEAAQPLEEISRLARMATAGTIPEAIRRCRRVSTAIGATSFVLFLTGRGPAAARLAASFDEHFPGTSPITVELIAAGADALSKHAILSSLPARWTAEGRAAAQPAPFIATLTRVLPSLGGIVLPVTAEGGQTGMFVFLGPDIELSQDETYGLHMLCMEMFAAIAVLKSGSAGSASNISKRELECLKLTAAGRTSEDIARILALSIHTANQYLTSAAGKLDAVNRMHAVAKAMRLGLID